MISVVMMVLGLLAFGFWGLAVWSAIAVVAMSESGLRLKNYFRLGLWKFAELEKTLGPPVIPHLRRYRMAFVAFFAVILGFLIIAALLAAEQQN